jgi:hypothetical protein
MVPMTPEQGHVAWVEATAGMRELVGEGSPELAALLLLLVMRIVVW